MTHHVDITKVYFPSATERDFILRIRAAEYPLAVAFKDDQEAVEYIQALDGVEHYFLREDDVLAGWAYVTVRDDQPWFAIILSGEFHKKGYGTMLLDQLKEDREVLYGWVVEADMYEKQDGSVYVSPVNFYIKNGFVLEDIFNESPVMMTRRMVWRNK